MIVCLLCLSCLQVIKEVLRYRPPAPMVPQVAMKPFKLTENYTVRNFVGCNTGLQSPLRIVLPLRLRPVS